MRQLTTELIDAALELGGSYFLPYRLHATREQLLRAYPVANEFFEKKREYDPEGTFVNKFYLQYSDR